MVNAVTAGRAVPLRAVLAFLALAAIGGGAQAADHPDLTGTWNIEKSHSDDPARPREERSSSSSSGGGSGVARQIAKSVSVFGIPVGSLPLPQGHEPEPLEADDLPGAEQVLSEVVRIRVLQEATATEFDYGGSLTATYVHADRSEDQDRTVRAGWDGEVFEIVHDIAKGTKVTETYRVDGNGFLHWLVRLEQKKAEPVLVERVFRREAVR